MSQRQHSLRSRHSVSEAARTATACVTCRNRKIKCSGTRPCRFCAKRRQDCVFPESAKGKKKLYHVAYVEDLERQSSLAKSPLPSIQAVVSPEQPSGSLGPASETQSDRRSVLVPESVMTSSLRFGTRIKDLSQGSVSATNQTQPLIASGSLDSPDDAYNLHGISDHALPDNLTVEWPSEDKAYALLETFLSSLSTVQHLLDARVFTDQLASQFATNQERRSVKSLWDVEFLLVMAIGELLQGSTDSTAPLPGVYLYKQAVACLPQIGSLRVAGVLAVEIMGLAAFYLQCADCKEDAYVYAGLSLRLAVSNGMARQENNKRSSGAIHRNRLWWTIYMQERRLAAATGNPMGINDDSVTTAFPSKTPLFPSADALNTNIRLARITGLISQDIYGRRHQSDREFVVKTQSVLTSLLETQKAMPLEYAVDLSDESRLFSRTGATLYLMLFQAIMLATRPVLLHTARSHLKKDQSRQDVNEGDPALLEKLSTVCVEAARNTLTIVETVQKQGILAKFGFFDLDAIFSAAFVFVMASVNGEDKAGRVVDIRSALNLLEFLSNCGNKAASHRLADIRQMCSRLGIDISPRPTRQPSNQTGSDTAVEDTTMAQALVNPLPVPPWDGIEGLLSGELDIFTQEGGTELANFWQESDFALDGTVETDWGEFERMTSNFQ